MIGNQKHNIGEETNITLTNSDSAAEYFSIKFVLIVNAFHKCKSVEISEEQITRSLFANSCDSTKPLTFEVLVV